MTNSLNYYDQHAVEYFACEPEVAPRLRSDACGGSLAVTSSRSPEAPRIFTRLRNSGLPRADNVR